MGRAKKKPQTKDSHLADGRWDSAVVRGALELLLDAIQPPDHCKSYLDELKSLARDPLTSKQLAAFLTQIANVIAETRFYSENKHQDQIGFMDNLVSGLKNIDQKLQGTEQTTLASFHANQKVSNILERTMTDIEHHIHKTPNLESIKIWLNQRLAILRVKVDDFRMKGTQSHASMHGQMREIASSVRDLEGNTQNLQSKLEEEIDEALVDVMTDVGSRVAYERKMREMLADPENVNGVLQIWDIDNLAEINRYFSWKAGNRTLRVIASILRLHLRKQDFIARYGSDKFAIILPNTNKQSAREIANRLKLAIKKSGMHHKGRDIKASVSGGGTVLLPKDTPTIAMQRANNALDKAKKDDRGKIVIN